jgi:hypothetical protein
MRNSEAVSKRYDNTSKDGSGDFHSIWGDFKKLGNSDSIQPINFPNLAELTKFDEELAELEAEFPTTKIEKKTLDEKYRDFLNKMSKHDGIDYELINNGMDIVINYGPDSVHMISYTNARAGERGPILGYFTVTSEDAAKPWFQEMISEVGGDVRVATPKPPTTNYE